MLRFRICDAGKWVEGESGDGDGSDGSVTFGDVLASVSARMSVAVEVIDAVLLVFGTPVPWSSSSLSLPACTSNVAVWKKTSRASSYAVRQTSRIDTPWASLAAFSSFDDDDDDDDDDEAVLILDPLPCLIGRAYRRRPRSDSILPPPPGLAPLSGSQSNGTVRSRKTYLYIARRTSVGRVRKSTTLLLLPGRLSILVSVLGLLRTKQLTAPLVREKALISTAARCVWVLFSCFKCDESSPLPGTK